MVTHEIARPSQSLSILRNLNNVLEGYSVPAVQNPPKDQKTRAKK